MNQTNSMGIITITGGVAKDERGQIRFVNDFNMEKVKRFYIIKNSNRKLVRGWRGHRTERRWFYVLSGAFYIDIVEIDDWEHPSQSLPVARYRTESNNQQVIYVPAGHATAFQSLETDSELLVFADCGVENSKEDDYSWPIGYFINREHK